MTDARKLSLNEWLLAHMMKVQPRDAWWWKEHGVENMDDYTMFRDIWFAAQENKCD